MARARLSMAFDDARGRMGGLVVCGARGGLVVKRRPRYHYPKNPEVGAGNERLRQASAAFDGLTLPQIEAWRAWAAGQTKTDPVSGQRYSPTARTAFIGLASKFLQASPGAAVPLSPPPGDFLADDLALSARAVSGGVRFTASGPNSPGVATELLVQPLPNIRRSPGKFYKSAAFHSFGVGLEFDLPLVPGVYALACQFVRLATGQVAGWRRLGVVVVG